MRIGSGPPPLQFVPDTTYTAGNAEIAEFMEPLSTARSRRFVLPAAVIVVAPIILVVAALSSRL